MNTLIGIWFLAVGLTGVLRPTFFFRSDKLTPEKIERNKRIWKWCGFGLIVCGAALLAVEIVGR